MTGPQEHAFSATFDEVWRAVNLVLQPYPLRTSNQDQGVIETDVIRDYHIWSPPYKAGPIGAGETYTLKIHVVRGAKGAHPAILVSVLKQTKVQVDFFSDARTQSSDGLEEKSILYRVGREIRIERALARVQKKENQSNSN